MKQDGETWFIHKTHVEQEYVGPGLFCPKLVIDDKCVRKAGGKRGKRRI
ncbi:Uncharacterised protein [Candidatus Burarchaeum australiense]|nr:Uncharacterised protein [Candidatus Burarchaeum australiense]